MFYLPYFSIAAFSNHGQEVKVRPSESLVLEGAVDCGIGDRHIEVGILFGLIHLDNIRQGSFYLLLNLSEGRVIKFARSPGQGGFADALVGNFLQVRQVDLGQARLGRNSDASLQHFRRPNPSAAARDRF